MAFSQFLCGLTVMIILSSKECDLASNYTTTVGGHGTPGSPTWLVSLNNDDGHFCGGSLITSLWVMTAAHCMKDPANETKVYVGRYSHSDPDHDNIMRTVADIKCHPYYDSYTKSNDICLLKLSSAVEVGDYIQTVCIAEEGSTFLPGTNTLAFGWHETENGNYSNILQTESLILVGNSKCKCTYPEITEYMICAGHEAGGHDSCWGHSGEPLVYNSLQIGVGSFGSECTNSTNPGVFTRVSKYEQWIKTTVGGHGGQVCSYPYYAGAQYNGYYNYNYDYDCTTHTYATIYPNQGGDSVFDSGESVIHFSHFISFCVLLLSLYVLIGDI